MKISDIQVSYVDHMGSDLSVVNAARVSFHKESDWEMNQWPDGTTTYDLSRQDEKLINYLAKHKHFSPFNHTFISLRIKAPIFVARQLVKHKFMPWNEVSRRYVDEEPEFYFPEYWRKKADNVKQGSSDEVVTKIHIFDMQFEDIKRTTERILDYPLELYNQMIDQGVCPEQARMVLPQNMMTEWIWSGTLGAYCDMLRLRLDPHTQYESRIVANRVRGIIEPLFPFSVRALLEN